MCVCVCVCVCVCAMYTYKRRLRQVGACGCGWVWVGGWVGVCRCVDWSVLFPAHCQASDDGKGMSRPIDFADIGCGFGGLLVQLVCARCSR